MVNLQGVNHFVEYKHFKMEGVPMLKNLLKPKDFLTKTELKDAYLTVPPEIPPVYMAGQCESLHH